MKSPKEFYRRFGHLPTHSRGGPEWSSSDDNKKTKESRSELQDQLSKERLRYNDERLAIWHEPKKLSKHIAILYVLWFVAFSIALGAAFGQRSDYLRLGIAGVRQTTPLELFTGVE
jgi:hypothetical protein